MIRAKNASPDGISPTCRSCQGRAARSRQTDKSSTEAPFAANATPETPSGWPKPTERKRYWAKVEETITELYALGNQKGKTKQLASV